MGHPHGGTDLAEFSLYRHRTKEYLGMCLRLVPIGLLAVLLCFPVLSMTGAAQGLVLWAQVVLPALMPFIICTRLVVATDGVPMLAKPFYPVFHGLLGLSSYGTCCMLCGLLCGYPLGAKMCSDFCSKGMISRQEASHLLAICNHPSPMFLLGYVQSQLPNPDDLPLLMICLYLPVLPLSAMAFGLYRKEQGKLPSRKTIRNQETSPQKQISESLEDIIASAAETMVLIGGYIMLFSILVAWITHLPLLSDSFRLFLMGAAEITTGIRQICQALPGQNCLLPLAACIAFGGCSGIFQTKSVIKSAGLSIRHYLAWKLTHALLSSAALLILERLVVLLPG